MNTQSRMRPKKWGYPSRPSRWTSSSNCLFRCEKDIHKAKLFDISAAGAGIESQAVPAVGDRLQIAFPKPSNPGSVFVVEATVRHAGRYLDSRRNFEGFGVRFERLNRVARKGIQELIECSTGPAENKVQIRFRGIGPEI